MLKVLFKVTGRTTKHLIRQKYAVLKRATKGDRKNRDYEPSREDAGLVLHSTAYWFDACTKATKYATVSVAMSKTTALQPRKADLPNFSSSLDERFLKHSFTKITSNRNLLDSSFTSSIDIKQSPFTWMLERTVLPQRQAFGAFRFRTRRQTAREDASGIRKLATTLLSYQQFDETENGYHSAASSNRHTVDGLLSPGRPRNYKISVDTDLLCSGTTDNGEARQLRSSEQGSAASPRDGHSSESITHGCTRRKKPGFSTPTALTDAGFQVYGNLAICKYCSVQVPMAALIPPEDRDPTEHALAQHLTYNPGCGYIQALCPPQTNEETVPKWVDAQYSIGREGHVRDKTNTELDTNLQSRTQYALLYPATPVYHGTRPPEDPEDVCHTPAMRFHTRRLATFSTAQTFLEQQGLWATRLAAGGFFTSVDEGVRRITCFFCGGAHLEGHSSGCLWQEYNVDFFEGGLEDRRQQEQHDLLLQLERMIDDGPIVLRGPAALLRRPTLEVQEEDERESLHRMIQSGRITVRASVLQRLENHDHRQAFLNPVQNEQLRLREPGPGLNRESQSDDLFQEIASRGHVRLRNSTRVSNRSNHSIQRRTSIAYGNPSSGDPRRSTETTDIDLHPIQEHNTGRGGDLSLHPAVCSRELGAQARFGGSQADIPLPSQAVSGTFVAPPSPVSTIVVLPNSSSPSSVQYSIQDISHPRPLSGADIVCRVCQTRPVRIHLPCCGHPGVCSRFCVHTLYLQRRCCLQCCEIVFGKLNR